MVKTTYRIVLNSVERVKAFCRLCMLHNDMVIAKDGMFTVDGKSILGLFSLDLTHPISVSFYGAVDRVIEQELKQYSINAYSNYLYDLKEGV